MWSTRLPATWNAKQSTAEARVLLERVQRRSEAENKPPGSKEKTLTSAEGRWKRLRGSGSENVIVGARKENHNGRSTQNAVLRRRPESERSNWDHVHHAKRVQVTLDSNYKIKSFSEVYPRHYLAYLHVIWLLILLPLVLFCHVFFDRNQTLRLLHWLQSRKRFYVHWSTFRFNNERHSVPICRFQLRFIVGL